MLVPPNECFVCHPSTEKPLIRCECGVVHFCEKHRQDKKHQRKHKPACIFLTATRAVFFRLDRELSESSDRPFRTMFGRFMESKPTRKYIAALMRHAHALHLILTTEAQLAALVWHEKYYELIGYKDPYSLRHLTPFIYLRLGHDVDCYRFLKEVAPKLLHAISSVGSAPLNGSFTATTTGDATPVQQSSTSGIEETISSHQPLIFGTGKTDSIQQPLATGIEDTTPSKIALTAGIEDENLSQPTTEDANPSRSGIEDTNSSRQSLTFKAEIQAFEYAQFKIELGTPNIFERHDFECGCFSNVVALLLVKLRLLLSLEKLKSHMPRYNSEYLECLFSDQTPASAVSRLDDQVHRLYYIINHENEHFWKGLIESENRWPDSERIDIGLIGSKDEMMSVVNYSWEIWMWTPNARQYIKDLYQADPEARVWKVPKGLQV